MFICLSILYHFQHTLQVPPQLHMPKSSLQFFSEPIYCYSHDHDLLSRCVRGPGTSSDRFLRVVAWHLSTIRLGPFCQAPLNPILGETHHVSSGSLNVIAEQVAFHHMHANINLITMPLILDYYALSMLTCSVKHMHS